MADETDATASTATDAPSGAETTKASGVTVDKSAAVTTDTTVDATATAAPIEGSGEAEVVETKAAPMDEQGFALEGDYPANRRLRAERLFDDGKSEDPDGIVTADDIVSAGERLTRQREADEAANPRVSESMKVAELEAIAESQGVDISSAANNEERVRLINDARAAGTARPANEEVR